MVEDLDDKSQDDLDLGHRLADVDHHGLVMVGIVQADKDFDRLLIKFDILEDVFFQQVIIGRLITTFLGHQHENMLHNR